MARDILEIIYFNEMVYNFCKDTREIDRFPTVKFYDLNFTLY